MRNHKKTSLNYVVVAHALNHRKIPTRQTNLAQIAAEVNPTVDWL